MSLTLLEALRLPPGPIADMFPKNGDEDIRQALERLAGWSEQDRQALVSQFAYEDRLRLDAYAGDVASLAVRFERLELVHSGLDALDIAYLGLDWTETEAMPLLYRACELIGADPRKEFGAAAERMHGVIKELALVYSRGEGARLEETRFIEVHEGDGFRFYNERNYHK